MLPDGSVGPDPCLRPPQGRGPRRQSPGYFRLLVPKDGTMGSARLPDTGGHFSRLLSQTSYYYWLSWVEGDARLPVVAGCRGSRQVSVEGVRSKTSVPATAVGLLFVVPVGSLS